jgi:hypothetical protein
VNHCISIPLNAPKPPEFSRFDISQSQTAHRVHYRLKRVSIRRLFPIKAPVYSFRRSPYQQNHHITTDILTKVIMARPKKTAVEKQQQPAPVPIPPQHIQQYPQHPQPIAAVPQQAMAVPMPAAVAVPQAMMPQRVVDNDSFLRVRDSVSPRYFI